MKPRCPRDVKAEHFEEMLNSVPEGFVFKRTWIPKSGPSFWRDFEFVAKKQPKPGYGLKLGDSLTLSCVLEIKRSGIAESHGIRTPREAIL